jgi:hypothetical protein
MALTPIAGQFGKLVTQFNSTNTTAAAINWNLTVDPKAKDVSNFRDGRFRAKTLQDATWSATIVHDSAAAEYLAANGGLVDGQIVTAYLYVGNSSSNANYAFTVPSMITSVGPKNEGVEGVIMYEVQGALHNGTVTYPVV